MREIFSLLESALSTTDVFRIQSQTSPSVLQARTALSYKYNPSVQYSVELYRQPGSAIGELRVSMRTQNSTLRLYLMQFFKLWASIERSYRAGGDCAVEDGRFLKKLQMPQDAPVEPSQWADAITAYVHAFDGAMKAFFYQIDSPSVAAAQVEQIYRDYLRHSAMPF